MKVIKLSPLRKQYKEKHGSCMKKYSIIFNDVYRATLDGPRKKIDEIWSNFGADI